MLPRELKAQFVAVIRRLMRPLVRQMIMYGVSYPAFEQIMKQLFVEVAERDFPLPFKRQTDSRLALVTGLTRKDVSQLRRQGAAETEERDLEDALVTHVIGRWMASPPYATPDGVPRRLQYEEGDGRAPSFARLVREFGVHVPVRAVLDELLRIGNAELLPDGAIELRSEAHIPTAELEGKLTLLGSEPAELFATIAHNIEHTDSPWLQRKVVYDNIGADALPALESEARRIGEEFTRRANALLASYDRDRNPDAPGGPRTRAALGIYYYEDASAAPSGDDAVRPTAAPPGRIRRKK